MPSASLRSLASWCHPERRRAKRVAERDLLFHLCLPPVSAEQTLYFFSSTFLFISRGAQAPFPIRKRLSSSPVKRLPPHRLIRDIYPAIGFGYGNISTMRPGKVWRTRHKFGGGLPLLPQPFHLSLPRPVGRHYRAVFAPAAAAADRASGTHLVCSLRNRHHRSDSWSANPRLDGSGEGPAIGDCSAGRRTQTQKIRRRLRKITSLAARLETSFSRCLSRTPRHA